MSMGPGSGEATEVEEFGTLEDGRKAYLYTVRSGKTSAQFTDFGARLVALSVPDREGSVTDVVFGYESFAEYVADRKTYCGASVGRYANRIAGGRFAIDGSDYQIPPNDNGNALHGGPDGFDRRVWQGRAIARGMEFKLVSPDGDQGFPGTLSVTVRYEFADGRLQIDFAASTDRLTVVNVTHHAYFNLGGESAGSILDHVLELPAEHFTPVDASLIPTGEIVCVEGTPFDFRRPTRIGERIDQTNVQLERGLGYDHNWALGRPGEMKLAARLTEPRSGRILAVETSEPGVQFYSGNHLDGSSQNREGGRYARRTGLCLETQHYPDSPNHADFPSTLLRPGQTLESQTVYSFSAA